jgi:hypothetical protein
MALFSKPHSPTLIADLYASLPIHPPLSLSSERQRRVAALAEKTSIKFLSLLKGLSCSHYIEECVVNDSKDGKLVCQFIFTKA